MRGTLGALDKFQVSILPSLVNSILFSVFKCFFPMGFLSQAPLEQPDIVTGPPCQSPQSLCHRASLLTFFHLVFISSFVLGCQKWRFLLLAVDLIPWFRQEVLPGFLGWYLISWYDLFSQFRWSLNPVVTLAFSNSW